MIASCTDRQWVSLATSGDAVIIVPPFAIAERPSMAAHVLQSVCATCGLRVHTFYAHLDLAHILGLEEYAAISDGSLTRAAELLGERLFARSAHGLPPMGTGEAWFQKSLEPKTIAWLRRIEKQLPAWCDRIAELVVGMAFPIVGCTSTFAQTNASLALLRRIKRLQPGMVTILGGANCESDMAEGIASLDVGQSAVDYIFSGECEASFPDFIADFKRGELPDKRIIRGSPCMRLDDIPPPDYRDYFEQRAILLPEAAHRLGETCVSYETSRGCWWGQKHHCTFCGLNGEGMAFRQKTPDKVEHDLRGMAGTYPTQRLEMVDNIMPHSYFGTLLPRLADRKLPWRIFYEQKANLSLAKLIQLKRAGVVSIQPGIEALCSDLLRRIKKGTLARRNIMLLRDARAVGLDLFWNLLWGIPGDCAQSYAQTLELIPKLRHLQPPSGLLHLSIDRFSPYYSDPQEYNLQPPTPAPAYGHVFPADADKDRLAYHFESDYNSGSHNAPALIEALRNAVEEWRARWARGSTAAPTLRIVPLSALTGDTHLLIDTRNGADCDNTQFLDAEQAAMVLTPRPLPADDDMTFAIEKKWGVVVDSWYVPLATASPELLSSLPKFKYDNI
jgi:ribosomal peptide maturation radical SAM protein 1